MINSCRRYYLPMKVDDIQQQRQKHSGPSMLPHWFIYEDAFGCRLLINMQKKRFRVNRKHLLVIIAQLICYLTT